MEQPKPGDVWTPRQDVEASGGARRVEYVENGVVAWSWGTRDEYIIEPISEWNAWVARHAATPEVVEDAELVRQHITKELSTPEGRDRLRANQDALMIALADDDDDDPTPPRPARDAALLAMAREGLGKARDAISYGQESLANAVRIIDATLATLATLDAEAGK